MNARANVYLPAADGAFEYLSRKSKTVCHVGVIGVGLVTVHSRRIG